MLRDSRQLTNSILQQKSRQSSLIALHAMITFHHKNHDCIKEGYVIILEISLFLYSKMMVTTLQR